MAVDITRIDRCARVFGDQCTSSKCSEICNRYLSSCLTFYFHIHINRTHSGLLYITVWLLNNCIYPYNLNKILYIRSYLLGHVRCECSPGFILISGNRCELEPLLMFMLSDRTQHHLLFHLRRTSDRRLLLLLQLNVERMKQILLYGTGFKTTLFTGIKNDIYLIDETHKWILICDSEEVWRDHHRSSFRSLYNCCPDEWSSILDWRWGETGGHIAGLHEWTVEGSHRIWKTQATIGARFCHLCPSIIPTWSPRPLGAACPFR